MDQLTALQRRERVIALVRWVATVFALGQVAFYDPLVPTLAAAAARTRPFAAALVGLLALVGVAAEAAVRLVRDADRLRQLGLVFLVADVAIAVAFVLSYRFDPVSSLWAVLTILPLEGAIRFQLAGAVGVAAVLAPAAAVREVLVARGTPVAFSAGVVTFRVGLLLLVALFAGLITRELDKQRRLLERLNAASRAVAGHLEPAEILRALCHQAVATLSARSAVVYVFDGQWFQPVAAWPTEALPRVMAEDEGEHEDPDLVGALLEAPTWLPADDTHPGRLVVPIERVAATADEAARGGGNILVVRPRRGRPRPAEVEATRSLAELAAVAMAATRVLAAEQRSNRRLRYLEALRTRFVATVAHDLRMPLTVFKGVSHLLRTSGDRIPAAQVHDLLGSVERQANRLARLADDLLDAARLDADKLALNLEPCDLAAVVTATVADAAEAVDVTVNGDLGLVADAARLERILWNLLSNAEKYGRPPYHVEARREAEQVVVSVRDHGKGLDDRQRSRLFSDFAGSEDAASVGLGLAIVWQLVQAHGGTVTYEDAGPGARFVVRLPAAGPTAD
jgi:signal transduction histidine kinase